MSMPHSNTLILILLPQSNTPHRTLTRLSQRRDFVRPLLRLSSPPPRFEEARVSRAGGGAELGGGGTGAATADGPVLDLVRAEVRLSDSLSNQPPKDQPRNEEGKTKGNEEVTTIRTRPLLLPTWRSSATETLL